MSSVLRGETPVPSLTLLQYLYGIADLQGQAETTLRRLPVVDGCGGKQKIVHVAHSPYLSKPNFFRYGYPRKFNSAIFLNIIPAFLNRKLNNTNEAISSANFIVNKRGP